MRAFAACWLATATVALMASGMAMAEKAPRFVDHGAGISFLNPFPDGTIKSQAELEAMNAATVAKASSITYTSGVTSAQKIPYLLVWTRPVGGELTKETVRPLESSSEEAIFKMIGVRHWRFDRAELRGTGAGPDVGALKSQVVLILTSGHYLYAGYFYQRTADLSGWKSFLKTLAVDKSVRLDYKRLPSGGPATNIDLFWAIVKGCVIGGLVAGVVIGGYMALTRTKAGKPDPLAMPEPEERPVPARRAQDARADQAGLDGAA